MRYYPIFLNIQGKRAVIVGGGRVAERKTLALLKAGASVTVVSPDITKPLQRLKRKGLITHIKREYRKRDIKDAFIVIAATSSTETNLKVNTDARNLVNVVDTPSLCNFIVPSIVKCGHLTIAISTEGHSPAVAKAIRKELEKLYGREFGRYLKFLRTIRKKAMKKIKDKRKRKRFLMELASQGIFNILRSKGFKSASEKTMLLFKNLDT